MKTTDVLIVAAALAAAVYLLRKKRQQPSPVPQKSDVQGAVQNNEITVYQPSVTQTDMDIIGWVANN